VCLLSNVWSSLLSHASGSICYLTLVCRTINTSGTNSHRSTLTYLGNGYSPLVGEGDMGERLSIECRGTGDAMTRTACAFAVRTLEQLLPGTSTTSSSPYTSTTKAPSAPTRVAQGSKSKYVQDQGLSGHEAFASCQLLR